jgi:hypothetical protein
MVLALFYVCPGDRLDGKTKEASKASFRILTVAIYTYPPAQSTLYKPLQLKLFLYDTLFVVTLVQLRLPEIMVTEEEDDNNTLFFTTVVIRLY